MELLKVVEGLSAGISGWFAFLSYRNSRTEERLVVSTPVHPDLQCKDHSDAVIQCKLSNMSNKKVFVDQVKLYEARGKELRITWSDQINNYGSPINPCRLITVLDDCFLFVRRDDGEEIGDTKLSVKHSFSNKPTVVYFEPDTEFINEFLGED